MEFENEDVILPDDYSEPQEEVVQDDVEPTEPTETVEDTTETDEAETEGMTEEQKEAFLKIKYNKEEIALDEEKAREYAQMGMNYPKLQEKLQALESDPRLSFVEELAQRQGMNTEEFIQAFREQQEQQQLNELIQQNIPEEYAREMLENRKFREQFQAKEKEQQQKAKQEQEFQAFLETYPDVKPDAIPNEVWEAQAKGSSLVDAYTRYENKQLKQQLQILKQNKQNTEKAPVGSVTNHGSQEQASEDPFLIGFNSI